MAGQPHLKSGKTFRYQATHGDVIGRGAYGSVFKGHFKSKTETSWEEVLSKKKPAAIKRVLLHFKKDKWMDIENDREVVALKELRHPYIVTLYAVEDDDDFRNFIFELCQTNLEELITEKCIDMPELIMPEEIEGLYQMASGLEFIHEKKMIHRDIKPENVLIYSDGKNTCLKIADLGLTKPLNEDGTHFNLASGLKGTEYYMAPELLVLRNLNRRDLNEKCTIASDVFAAGCTFFRYCADGGLHPFGNDFNIEGNIMNGDPINLTEYNGERWKIDLITEMIKFDPEKRLPFSEIVKLLAGQSSQSFFQTTLPGGKSLQHVIVVQSSRSAESIRTFDNFRYDRKNCIGRGGYGTIYTGTFNDEKVAVRLVQILDSAVKSSELENNKKLSRLNHPNIVQFKHYEEDDTFMYFVLELCAVSLRQFFEKDPRKISRGKYQGPMPTDEQVLFQLASGLEYIHSEGIFYRNFKPNNVMISLTKPVQMKYINIGCTKLVRERGFMPHKGMKETFWMSPEELEILMLHDSEKMSEEMFEENKTCRGSFKSDIFSAGCLFIYYLLRGRNPYGEQNISTIKNIPVIELPKKHFARPFVSQMIEHEPEKRISLSKVIEYLEPLQPPNRLSLLQYDHQNLLSSMGTLSSHVYDIGTFEGSSLAVKRVPIEDCTTKSFDELKQLNNSNIIRLIHFDKDDFYKYFGMELCVSSLDQLFLPEDDKKKYSGLIPSDEQFCFQLISGLQYIHEKKLVHGSIKPTNILISSRKDPQIKLSDFGLTTTSRLNEGHTTQRSIAGFLSSRYWLAPELLDPINNRQNKPTKESDIFSAGSVFFYFLSKGRHLFGDLIHDILTNMLNGFQSNLFGKMPAGHFAMGLIRWMTQKHPKQRMKMSEVFPYLELSQPVTSVDLKTVRDSRNRTETIQFSRTHLLDKGGYGTVYLGRCKSSGSEIIVVKRVELLRGSRAEAIDRELTALQKLNHPKIVKFFDSALDDDFIYFAMEKCLTSLDWYCRKPLLYHGVIPMPSEQQVLLQMAEGLHYIHSQIVNGSQPLIHRDVKPENILISCDNPAVIKWADFGLSRAVVTGSKSFTWSQLKGTERWLAPELIQQDVKTKVRGSQSCDVFALGCVFFFYLTQGIHPFGDGDKDFVQINIKNANSINKNKLSNEHFAFRIIDEMIQLDPHKRPKMSVVVAELHNDLVMMSPSPVKKPRKETIKK